MEFDRRSGLMVDEGADRNWQDEARCQGTDPELFFDDKHTLTIEAAKKVCAECVVRLDCLEYALDNREKHGVWGGKSERERRRILRQRRAA